MPQQPEHTPMTSRPGTISVDDVPGWVQMPPERYVALRELAVEQMLHLVQGAGFDGSWVRLAAQTLSTIGVAAPEQGSHHHQCIIIAEALRPIYEAPDPDPAASQRSEDVARLREALTSIKDCCDQLRSGTDDRGALTEIGLVAGNALAADPVPRGAALPHVSQQPSSPAAAASAPRPFTEWHEDHGDVLWWRIPIQESPYVGSPLDLGRSMKVEISIGLEHHELSTVNSGGWPFAESDEARLFWTPLPDATDIFRNLKPDEAVPPEREGVAVRTFTRRSYRAPDGHVPYPVVFHNAADQLVCKEDIFSDGWSNGEKQYGLLSSAGVSDGDEFTVTVRKTGARPFGDRQVLLVSSGKYRLETDAEMAFRLQHGRSWDYRTDPTLAEETGND